MAKAKEEAASRGETLTAFIERGLRLMLAGPAQRGAKRRMRIPVSTASGGTHRGVDLGNSVAFLNRIEAQDDSSRR